MNEPKYVSQKLVTVKCYNPFRIGLTPFVGLCSKILLKVEDISICLEHKAIVTEHLKGGKEIPLDFTNYNTYNGEPDVNKSNGMLFTDPRLKKGHEITVIDQDGNKRVINSQTGKEDEKIIHVDLESQKQKEAEERRLAEQKQKEEEEKKALQEKLEKEKKEQEEKDAKIKADAIKKVLEERGINAVKKEEEKKNINNILNSIKVESEIPASLNVNKEVVNTELTGSLEVKSEEKPADSVITAVKIPDDIEKKEPVKDFTTSDKQNHKNKKPNK